MSTMDINCRVSKGTDTENNPPTFHEEGDIPEV